MEKSHVSTVHTLLTDSESRERLPLLCSVMRSRRTSSNTKKITALAARENG